MSEEIKKYLGIEGAQALKVALEAEMDAKDEAVKSLLTGDGADKIVVDEANKATQDSAGNIITEVYETKEDAKSKLDAATDYTDEKIGTVPENSTVMSIITNIQENAYDDTAIRGRLEEIEAFFRLADGEQLDTALDTLKEIQDYLNTEGTAADEMLEKINALEEIKHHDHDNKALLDTYTQTNEDLTDAVDKKHSHDNEGILNGITQDKVDDWNNAEQNAKDYADGLNDSMNERVVILEKIDHSAYMLKSSEITADEVNDWFSSTQA